VSQSSKDLSQYLQFHNRQEAKHQPRYEEEKLTKLKQIKETEEIEQKALELHKKEKDLKK